MVARTFRTLAVIVSPLILFALLLLAPSAVVAAATPAASVVPGDSTMARADTALRRTLLSPLGSDAPIHPGGWRLAAPTATPAPADVPPQVGRSALRLSG